jgi:exosome complex exonuclease RRP6
VYILYLQEKVPIEQLIDRNVPDGEPVKPPALDDTPFTFVEDLKTLEVLATKLKNATEFAVSVLVSWRCPQVYM